MNDTLYGLYIKERQGKEILQSEIGFATFFYLDEKCYIEDIFVKEEYRKGGEASRLADEIGKIAKEKGCKQLVGSVVPSAKGSTDSLRILLAYGFKLDSSSINFIAMTKELEA